MKIFLVSEICQHVRLIAKKKIKLLQTVHFSFFFMQLQKVNHDLEMVLSIFKARNKKLKEDLKRYVVSWAYEYHTTLNTNQIKILGFLVVLKNANDLLFPLSFLFFYV